jgi:hypothetical protein
MALRNVDNALKNALVDNVPLQVYHLVKFEKPSNINYEKNNQTTPDTNYVYLTDAPYPVDFDNQTYNPTHFSKVGVVTEDIEAKATGMSLTLNANNLGRDAIVTLTCGQLAIGGSTTATVDLDLFQSGFQVGDEIKFKNTQVDFIARLDRVRSATSIDITAITSIPAVSSAQTTATFNSSAITALTSNSSSALNFQSYINKTVDIYRCFVNPKTGDLYGTPVLLFKGIIAKGSLKERGAGNSEMTWTLTSHWGDFVRVQGRLTSDEFHRALDGPGVPNTEALIRPEYEHDFGFEHAEKSLNVLAPYIDTKTRTKLRKSSSWFGLRKSYSQEEETYQVAQDLDLQINLAAKFIPVVYGVNRIDAIPVFADIELGLLGQTESDGATPRSTDLYTVNVISEGPIRAIYDIIVDEEGLVCRDEKDKTNRGVGAPASNYTGSTCVGVMTKGDVLEGSFQYNWWDYVIPINSEIGLNLSYNSAVFSTSEDAGLLNLNGEGYKIVPDVLVTTAQDDYSSGPIGITHQKHYKFNFGGDNDIIDITHHAGIYNQPADFTLRGISQRRGFKIQQSFYEGKTNQDYWNINHRLLDTAYTVQKDVISASSGQQPAFEYIVKGKYVNCINYDGSYKAVVDQDRNTNYQIGDVVNVFIGPSNTGGTSAKIIDKWYQYDPWGAIDWRFKFASSTSDMSILTPIIEGTAGKVTMRPVADGLTATTNDWVMKAENYTGDDTNPVQTTTTTGTGGVNLFSVGGMVFDGTNFTLTSVDFIVETRTNTQEGILSSEADVWKNLFAETGQVPNFDETVATVTKTFYAFDFNEIYTNAFTTSAIKILADQNKSVFIEYFIGDAKRRHSLTASMILGSLNSTNQGLCILDAKTAEQTSWENLKNQLIEGISDGVISTTQVVSTTSVLDPVSSSWPTATYGVTRYNNLPSISLKNYNLIYQDSSDQFTPSSEADGLHVTFSRDAGGDFTKESTIYQPGDSTLSTFCDTNNILLIGHTIIINSSKEDLLTGLKYSYGAETETVLEPGEGGTTQGSSVYSVQDARVTNNPAMILLDYLTNKRFGKGLSTKLLDLPSFKEAARTCDTQSDVTVLVTAQNSTLTNFVVGDICRYPSNTAEELRFEGEISSITKFDNYISRPNTTPVIQDDVWQITFKNCIGKIGRKWEQNATYSLNEVVWTVRGKTKLIGSSEVGTAINEPTTTEPSAITFKNVTRSSTFNIDHTMSRQQYTSTIIGSNGNYPVERKPFTAPSGNPLVKQINLQNSVYKIVSGYSLYDSDEIRYWKYLGWESWEQRWVTRHQLNPIIDTSRKLFENVNTLLQQFNGILRYSNGKYYLDMRVKAKPISEFDLDTEVITEKDIIGDIKIDDKGISKTFNAFSAQSTDPALLFKNRTVSFFNSDYLAQDKGIQRQGTYRAPAITNYFNLRINAKQALDESRAGLTVSFQMPPKGYLLLAGNIIAITYSNFNWENKLFRIESLKTRSDLLVDIVAKEHNDDAFILEHMANDLITPYGEESVNPNVVITRPINLIASQIVESEGAVGGIELNWENTGDYSTSTHSIEVWMNPTNGTFSGATHILTASGTTIIDPILKEQGTTERYYWIRYKVTPGMNSSSNNLDPVFSRYYPAKDEEGVRGFGSASLPERIHGIPKGATSNTAAKISTNSSSEFFSLSAAWTVDPEFGGTIPSGAYVMQRLTEPLGAKRYQFVWNGQRVGNYKWRGPDDTHTLSDIKLLDAGEEYTIGSLQSSYSTTTTVTNGTRNWDYYAIKSTRTDGISQGSEDFIFDAYPAILASQGAPGNPANVTEVNAVVNLSNVADNDTRELYVIFDHNVPKCFLAEWDVTTNNYGPDYWRDIGDGSATLDTAWTAISGTSFTRDSGYTITGVGTTFTTDFQEGDVVAYKATELTSSSSVVGETSAFVVQIISDTQIRLDRLSPAASTINYLYRTAYRPDTTNDAVIAQIDRGS